MKKKLGTILDEDLVYKAKKVALIQKRSLSDVLENALKMYLLATKRENAAAKEKVSEKTSGALKISPDLLKTIMEEEDFYEIG